MPVILGARPGQRLRERRRCGHVRNKRQKSPLGGSGGPYSSGKSTLFEALMDAAGAPVKRPADPRNRPMTTEIRLGHCSYLGDAWSILDCPGSIEFAYQTAPRCRWSISRWWSASPHPAKRATVAPLLKLLATRAFPTSCSSTRSTRWTAARATRSRRCRAIAQPLVLRQMPIFDGQAVDRLCRPDERARLSLSQGPGLRTDADSGRMLAEEQAALGRLVETLADHDDALLEKVLDDIKPTPRGTLPRHAQGPVRARDRGAAWRRGARQRGAPAVEGAAP